MKIDADVSEEKNLPIKNVICDMRHMLLAPKIEKIIGRRQTVDQSNLMIDDGNEDGITEMQFARFLQVQNKAFGSDVA